MKTSVADPIRVDFVPQDCLRGTGRLGLTIAPGKKDASRGWDRDLEADLQRLRQVYEASVLVSLMEEHEYAMLGIPTLLDRAREVGLAVHWFPMRDISVPRTTQADAFESIVVQVWSAIQDGKTVIVHCRGGLGRSGLFAACVLARCGMSIDEAIAATRAARPGAIETREQEGWVRRFRPAGESRAASTIVGQARTNGGEDTALGTRSVGDPSRDRVLGCLLGGALGDAVGYPVEFSSVEDIKRRFGAEPPGKLTFAGSPVGSISDDTQMTLFVAEGLIRALQRFRERGICHPESVGLSALMRWYATQTGARVPREGAGWLVRERRLHARRAPGNTIRSALGAEAARTGDEPTLVARNNSKGCGTIMRAAPFGFLSSPEEAFDHAVNNARLTHGHPTAALSAGYMAALVWSLSRGANPRGAMTRADEILSTKPDREETAAAVLAACELAANRGTRTGELERLGGGWVAEEALAFGVACLLAFDPSEPRAVERTLWRAACHGGDSDSTASITGNLLGAMLGAEALPADWLQELELRDAIERIGADLWASLVQGESLDMGAYPPS